MGLAKKTVDNWYQKVKNLEQNTKLKSTDDQCAADIDKDKDASVLYIP